jgi:hypothetical protein
VVVGGFRCFEVQSASEPLEEQWDLPRAFFRRKIIRNLRYATKGFDIVK